MTMQFREFVKLCKRLRATQSINEKTILIASFLSKLDKGEWKPFIMLISGNAVPESLEGGLGIGLSMVRKALKLNVKPLFASSPPTIKDVYDTLLKISGIRGPGSQSKKLEVLASLFSQMTDEEREWLVKIIFGELRIGVEEGLILNALSRATGYPADDVRRVYMIRGELNTLVDILLGKNINLKTILPELFKPLKPMLATPASNIREAFEMIDDRVAAVEVKYDGARLQIHIKNDIIKFFSRRLSDVTKSLPDLKNLLLDILIQRSIQEAIVEGEVIAIDRSGKPLPFQDLMKRFRRIKNIDEIIQKIPVRLYLFDILYLNKKLLIDLSYKERYSYLKKTFPNDLLADRIVTDKIADAKAFYEKALEDGHEGVMIKNLNAPYILGSRGKFWIKVKASEFLDLVIIGAEWGHGRRKGWLSDYYLAVYNPTDGNYSMVGKTFKGLTDEEFQYMTNRLLNIVVRDEGYRVWVKPEIVVEVAFNEIQKSPKYESGLALRLARIIRIREDKSPHEATTLEELQELYGRQFRFKGKL